MPRVLSQYGEFRFMIYLNDHEPMHVHVFHQNGEAVINFAGALLFKRKPRIEPQSSAAGNENSAGKSSSFTKPLERNKWIK